MIKVRLYVRGVFLMVVPVVTLYDNKWLAFHVDGMTFRFDREYGDPESFLCNDPAASKLFEYEFCSGQLIMDTTPPKPLRRPKRLSPAHLRLLQKMDKIREKLRRADNDDTTEP